MKKIRHLSLFLWLFLISFQSAAGADNHLTALKSYGVLYFGTSPDYVPFVFYDQTGQVDGLDIALIREIGARMGVRIEVVDLAYDGLLDAARVRQVDLIGGALTRTAENDALVDFSRAYYRGTGRIVALAETEIRDLHSLKNLSGSRIGVQDGTNFDQWLRTNLVASGIIPSGNIVTYPAIADAMDGLERNETDFVLLDQYTYERYFSSSGKFTVVNTLDICEEFVFASYSGSSLIPEIDRHLEAMILDGTAQRIAEAYFTKRYQIKNPRMPGPSVSEDSQFSDQQPADPQSDAPCINAMRFAGDVTIPDGSQITGGTSFTKIWRVFNLGTCTWDTDYRFVRKNGPLIGGYPLTERVSPGNFYDFSVMMLAPTEPGAYKSNWQLQTPEGRNFGQTIWVDIEVPEKKDGS